MGGQQVKQFKWSFDKGRYFINTQLIWSSGIRAKFAMQTLKHGASFPNISTS